MNPENKSPPKTNEPRKQMNPENKSPPKTNGDRKQGETENQLLCQTFFFLSWMPAKAEKRLSS